MKTALRTIAVAGTTLATVAGFGPEAAATDFCRLTAQAVLRSCRLAAKSDGQLAIARCDNSPTARKGCVQQAARETKDALDTCKGQHDARQAVCKRLGGAPYDPAIDPANFVATIDNPYFPLQPGTTFVYEGQTADGLEHDEFFVTHATKVIFGVTCVEVHDTVHLNGQLTEDTLDWFAQDTDGNVWYFGENSEELVGGLVVSLEGSWTGGVEAARPGIIMEGAHPAVGDFYRQEFAVDSAEDLAEVVSLDEPVTVRAGPFGHCLKTKETSPLEPDALEFKFYAANVGNVLTVDQVTGEKLELVRITTD